MTGLAEEPTRSEASPGVLEPRISENPFADPALRLFSRLRHDRVCGGVRIAAFPVSRRGSAGLYRGDRLHYLVRRSRAFRAGRSIMLGLLRLLLYRAALLPRNFQQRSTLLLHFPRMGG